jgi:hypothetical protein
VTPGTRLLKFAPFLFNPRFIATVVRPTIADLQSEFTAAGPDRVKRLRAQCRGYAAFWTLAAVAPFALWSEDLPTVAWRRLAAGTALISLFTIVTVGAWVALVFAAAILVAFLIHAWYERHPSELPMPPDPPWRSPQINFSSTEVGGNVGGLIFALGTVLIVALGVPSGLWFLIAGAVGACIVACALVARRTRAHRDGWTLAGRPPRQLF